MPTDKAAVIKVRYSDNGGFNTTNLLLHITKRTAFYAVLYWLGWKDLNPRNGGVRVRCLTTWRHPNIRFCCRCRDNVDYYITTKL